MPKSNPHKRREQTRKSILISARKLIGQDGVERFSIRKLAAETGYSAAGLYEYFDNREAILRAVAEERAEHLSQSLQGLPLGLSPSDELIAICLSYLDFVRRQPASYSLIADLLDEDPAAAQIDAAILRGSQSGHFLAQSEDELRIICHACINLLRGLARKAMRIGSRGRKRREFETLSRQVLRLVIRGFEKTPDG